MNGVDTQVRGSHARDAGARDAPPSGTGLGVLGLLIGVLVLLVPVLVAPLPPLGDLPNHLARLWLLSSAAARESVAAFYRVQFDTYTNIGIDLLAASVGRVAGYMAAGRLAVALAVVLPPLGGAVLWWSAHRRVHWWMVSFGLLAWGSIVVNGFLNYQIAIGLALLFAAAEPAVGRRGWVAQGVARAGASVLLLLAHPFGLLFYALLLGALAIGPRVSAGDVWRAVGRLAPAGVAIVGVAALFVLIVPSLPGTEEHSNLGTVPAEVVAGLHRFGLMPGRKLFNALFAIRAYDNRVDGLTVAALLFPLALALAVGRLRAHGGLLLLGVGLLGAYLVCPEYLLGAGWVDGRFAVMMLYVLAAAVAPTLGEGWGRLAAGVLLLVFVGRTAYVAAIWHARQADVASLAEALQPVPAGASVLTLEHRAADRRAAPVGRYSSGGENSFRHLPALAVPWRQAFVPTLFSARGKQPLVVLPPWDAVAEPNAGILNDVHVIDAVSPQEADPDTLRYMRAWRRFDYLLVLNADVPDEYGPFVPPPGVGLVRDAGFAQLFCIAH